MGGTTRRGTSAIYNHNTEVIISEDTRTFCTLVLLDKRLDARTVQTIKPSKTRERSLVWFQRELLCVYVGSSLLLLLTTREGRGLPRRVDLSPTGRLPLLVVCDRTTTEPHVHDVPVGKGLPRIQSVREVDPTGGSRTSSAPDSIVLVDILEV